MISVIVERAPADRQGQDISDSLICTDAVAIERGRNEIDGQCSARERVEITRPLRGWVDPGALVEVADAEDAPWRGMVTGCVLELSRSGETELTALSTLTIEREAGA